MWLQNVFGQPKMKHEQPILVLGSNSFSATSFVDYLLSESYKVIGIGRSDEVSPVFRRYGNNTNLANFSFARIDMNEGAEEIAGIVQKNQVKYVFNFAAQSMVAQSWDYPEDWYQTNVVALAKLGNLLIKEKTIEKFIHFTTPEVYGSTNGWLKESFDFAPSTPYATSRAAGDWHLRSLFDNYGFPVVFTRAANVYGPGQQLYRIIPRTVLSALTGQKLPLHGGGKSIRSFIHIDDVSSALEAIMKNGKSGDSYHISTDAMTSIFELVTTLANLLNVDVEELVERGPERPGKDFAYQLSSEKVRTELGWKDMIDLDSGLADTLEWAKLHLGDLRKLPFEYEHKR
jgi:dTDP-glucose 4,6-dehydratase